MVEYTNIREDRRNGGEDLHLVHCCWPSHWFLLHFHFHFHFLFFHSLIRFITKTNYPKRAIQTILNATTKRNKGRYTERGSVHSALFLFLLCIEFFFLFALLYWLYSILSRLHEHNGLHSNMHETNQTNCTETKEKTRTRRFYSFLTRFLYFFLSLFFHCSWSLFSSWADHFLPFWSKWEAGSTEMLKSIQMGEVLWREKGKLNRTITRHKRLSFHRFSFSSTIFSLYSINTRGNDRIQEFFGGKLQFIENKYILLFISNWIIYLKCLLPVSSYFFIDSSVPLIRPADNEILVWASSVS